MKEKLQIYMDLDGTILDNSKRHYEVYRSTYHWLGLHPLSFNSWLKTTRNGELLLPEEQVEKYIEIFQNNFELPYYLQLDTLFEDMGNIIENIDHFNNMSIVTLRGDKTATEDQVKKFININPEVISGYPNTISKESFITTKKELILSKTSNPSGCIIGDTEYEILVGKELGLRTIAVTWGSRSKNFLEKYNPDVIINRPYEILDVIWMMRKC